MAERFFRIPDDLVIGGHFNTAQAAPESWAMKATRIQDLRDAGGDGLGQVVAVLDTGADVNHPEFPPDRWHAPPWSNVPGESPADQNGHGPHCLSTAAGNTPTVGVGFRTKYMSGKCLSNAGSGSTSWIRAAWTTAVAKGATVISMSIGGPGFLEEMEDLFREGEARGVVSVVAAGNERAQGGRVGFQSSAIVVAAVDALGNYAPFSNPATQAAYLSVAAPGVGILGARSRTTGYVLMSGTSMATPFVAGVVACVQSARVKRNLKPLRQSEVRSLFGNRSVDAGRPGADTDFGPGLIDARYLALALESDPPPLAG